MIRDSVSLVPVALVAGVGDDDEDLDGLKVGILIGPRVGIFEGESVGAGL